MRKPAITLFLLLLATLAARSQAPSGTTTPPNSSSSTTPAPKSNSPITGPRTLYAPAPEFPKGVTAARALVAGTINERGQFENLRILRSTDSRVDAAALAAAAKYRFQPAVQDGKPISVSLQVNIEFYRY